MGPFEYITLFLSFIYTLALTHLLFAASRMIRHRRELVFSVPHALWMVNALMILVTNWLSCWDFHVFERVSLAVIAAGFALSVLQYFVCALVSPDFEGGERFDMRAFHAEQGRTYIVATLIIFLVSIAINFGAGFSEGLTNWTEQNLLVACFLPPILLALLVRRRWAQVLGPAAMLPLWLAYFLIYYPFLSR